MSHTPLTIWCIILTIVVVAIAVVTDLLWRRIPNLLTFPALGLAIAFRIALQGWVGLGLALAGAFLAPTLLLVMHGGKGLGMGDLKLAAAVGAIMGPALAVASMLFAAVAGGILGIVMMLRPGGSLRNLISVISIGLPFRKKKGEDEPAPDDSPAVLTMPYGLAIGAGSLMTLAVYWWTGNENWFLSFVGIAGKL